MKDGKAVLIDVREPDQWMREHLAEAYRLPLSGIKAGDFPAEDLPKDHDKIVVLRLGGAAAGPRRQHMAEAGLRR